MLLQLQLVLTKPVQAAAGEPEESMPIEEPEERSADPFEDERSAEAAANGAAAGPRHSTPFASLQLIKLTYT